MVGDGPAPTLEQFAENLRQDVLALAESEGEEQMLADSFTQIAFDLLAEDGEVEDPVVCYFRSTGVEVSGYQVDEDEGRLDLFVSICTQTVPPETVTKAQIDTAFKRLLTFYRWCIDGKYKEMEESSPAFDMAFHIHQVGPSLTKIRLWVITDGKTTVDRLSPEELESREVTKAVWDIVRLQRLATSGGGRGSITIDFMERFGTAIPCLRAESSARGYRAFLVLLSGDVLRNIYAEFGPRLLERNVRSFLQARGKVNRGIRDTILHEPERFLAYNNGITMTAKSVQHSGEGISRIDDLQIVNGGQTTASLLSTNKGRADLSEVFIAGKLIEIGEGAAYEELVRNVSRFANTQNKVSEADFSSNDPFHVKLEELSRTIWAPAVGGTQKQTRWFYERARGQYQDRRSSQRTPAQIRAWTVEHPPSQRFTKTDLAKFENSWEQLPHIVSRGAQKNFTDFMIRLRERGQFEVDADYFQRLIAKAILFRTTEKVVQRQEFGGYRANIVAYSIAYLARNTAQRLDFSQIWREQRLSDPLQVVMAEIATQVFPILTSPPGAQNVTEWCKKPECWEAVGDKLRPVDIEAIKKDLLDSSGAKRAAKRLAGEVPELHMANLKRIVEVNAAAWEMLATWGAETKSLTAAQKKVAFDIAKAIRRSSVIPPDQAEEAVSILDRAKELGYEVLAV